LFADSLICSVRKNAALPLRSPPYLLTLPAKFVCPLCLALASLACRCPPLSLCLRLVCCRRRSVPHARGPGALGNDGSGAGPHPHSDGGGGLQLRARPVQEVSQAAAACLAGWVAAWRAGTLAGGWADEHATGWRGSWVSYALTGLPSAACLPAIALVQQQTELA
jgi:hypothetical protein